VVIELKPRGVGWVHAGALGNQPCGEGESKLAVDLSNRGP